LLPEPVLISYILSGWAGIIRGCQSYAQGVAKVTHPSTESLSHGANTLKESKIARLPEMCRGQANLGTELILLSVHALDEFPDAARHAIKSTKCQIGVFLGSLESIE
jgi:hypothetical protein